MFSLISRNNIIRPSALKVCCRFNSTDSVNATFSALLQNSSNGKTQSELPSIYGALKSNKSILSKERKYHPRDVAKRVRLTGVAAGRTVEVTQNLSQSLRNLNRILKVNEIKSTINSQRYHIKPAKALKARKAKNHRIRFMKGFKELMGVVSDAMRKGY